MSATSAADRLASPREHGTLRLAYRRSAMALQNVFDWLKPQEPQGERESLLQSENREGNSSAQYGSTLQVPADQRVPRPKPVKSPVRVEAKVWFANEVGTRVYDFMYTHIWTTAHLDILVASFIAHWCLQPGHVQLGFLLFHSPSQPYTSWPRARS